ncbi:MAG: RNA methyltransferase [Azoarcus sp.]|jgi:TrmH family RNA methyltransferase|nr:RNA methyltransferase [Azoarcus sp.]
MATRFTVLASRNNPRLKLLAALADSAHARREHGQTLLDGVHLLDCALAAKVPLLEVCVSESGRSRAEIATLLARLPEKQVPVCVPDALFAHISPVDTPTGILASIVLPVSVQPQANEPSVVVLDAIQDPGNLGAILRTAAAAGIEAVWLLPGCAQAWSPKVLRAGMGAHFRLRISEQADALAGLGGYGGKVVATGVGVTALTLFDADLRGPLAWLFGAEGQGVSPTLLARADEIVTIPMAAGIESLNVGAAAAVCLFEQLRQCRWPDRRGNGET